MGKAMDGIMGCSQYFEGEPDTGWELVGMEDNGTHYIRYYVDKEGKYWHASQKKKGRAPRGKLMLWEDRHGRAVAKRVYPKRNTKRKQ